MNAEDWISSARRAVAAAVRFVDGADVTPILRHRHDSPSRPWASFEIPETGDVIWVAQVDGDAPEGSHVVSTELGDVGVWRHPNDPALPGLRTAVTPGASTELLRRVSRTVDPHVVEIVTLAPLQRATVRIGHVDHAVYVKVMPPSRAASVADAHRRAAEGVPSPQVLHVDAEQGLVVFGEVPGRPLAEHLERGLPLPEPDELWKLVEGVMAAVGAHGDFHDRQILVDDSGNVTGVVDFDDAGGDPLDDLADLVAHVIMRGITHPEQRDRITRYVDELRTTFSRHVDAVELERRIVRTAARLRERRTSFGAGR